MSLALGKNSANSKQPLHLDNSNHLLVNDSVNKAVLETIATNTANINVNVGDVEINVADLEALQATTNAKLIEISGKNTDIDNSVKANAITVAKLNQILTKNTEIDTVLDSCSAKLTDVDDSVKANAVTVAKLNQILTKNTEIDTVLDTCSAKLSDIDTTAAATATILRPYLIEGNATTVLIKSSLQSLDDIVQGEDASHNNAHKGVMSLAVRQDSQADFGADGDYCPMSIDANGDLRIKLDTVSTNHLNAIKTDAAALEVLQTATNSKLDDIIGHNDGVETLLTAIDGRVDGLETLQGAANTDLAAIEVLLTSANTDHAANEALLTTIDADTNNIKTSTAACATDLAAIEVLLTSANTDHAANEVLLTAIDSDTNNIKTSTASCATDLAALEVLQTATNSKIDTFDAVLDASLVKQTAMTTDIAALEVLHTATNSKIDTFDAVLDASLVKQTAMTTDLAAIEILLTAANVDHAANEALLINAEAHLGEIEGAVETIETAIKAEDAAHSSGDTGIMALCVRQDSQADFGANGDYVPMSINADGELRTTGASASTVMTVDTLMNNVSIASSATTNSSVFTKPKDVSNFAVLVSSASGSGGFALRESKSVDGTTYIENNTNLNAASARQLHVTETLAQFKFYRYAITNVEVGSVNHTIKISY